MNLAGKPKVIDCHTVYHQNSALGKSHVQDRQWYEKAAAAGDENAKQWLAISPRILKRRKLNRCRFQESIIIWRTTRAACWLSLRFIRGYNIRHGLYGILEFSGTTV